MLVTAHGYECKRVVVVVAQRSPLGTVPSLVQGQAIFFQTGVHGEFRASEDVHVLGKWSMSAPANLMSRQWTSNNTVMLSFAFICDAGRQIS